MRGVDGTPLNIITGGTGSDQGDLYLEATTDTDLKTDCYSLFGHVDFYLTDELLCKESHVRSFSIVFYCHIIPASGRL